ncbi:DUF3078 domain-containing protein [Parabacteroides sp. GYB001]|uniref:DUF3078 domain-containing protein n=1 Tax=Parabacteroides leei TaxID=2939491 RepID=UPI0020178D7B|nr:DUF3078 domain-containing protein [Parabacteroides leei]MCL3849688.1 DUF3078 domain-containing protein [Parabacteroides leei]
MVIKRYFILFSIFTSLASLAEAQEKVVITGTNVNNNTTQRDAPDTIPMIEIEDPDLDNIISLRGQFEKQNRSYSAPVVPNENLLRFLKKDEVEISDEAMYWARLVRDASTIFDNNMTFRDTVIVNPLFLPIVFKGELLPKDLTFYKENFWVKNEQLPLPFTPDTLFKQEELKKEIEDKAYKYVQSNYPDYFRYSMRDLPQDKVIAKVIKKTHYEPELIKIESEADFSDVDAPVKFIPEIRYWTSHFESAIQFAQNYISPNWHKGGVSTLNLTNRELFTFNYNKDKIKFTNSLEIKNNLYTAPKDTLRDYKVGDDVFRIYSNLGYRAFNKWYYTLDVDFKTQLFSSYAENQDVKLAGLLSPFSINIGLGMKYDLDKTFASSKHKKVTLSANLAPLSYTYVRTLDKDIDLGRHFQKKKGQEEFPYKQSLFGSTVNATMTFQFSRNIIWYSRLYYMTDYKRIQGEFENRLNMAISRFFSTIISLNLRYDDGIAKNEDFDSYLQINELLSFGFNYKW